MAFEVCPRCSNKLGPPLRSGKQVCMKCAWSGYAEAPQVLDEAPFDAPTATQGLDAIGRTMFSMLVHGGIFLTGVLPIMPLLALQLSEDWVVRQNAKEALNLQISLIFYGVCLITVMIVLKRPTATVIWGLGLIAFFYPLLAIVHCMRKPDVPFTYPLILHPLN